MNRTAITFPVILLASFTGFTCASEGYLYLGKDRPFIHIDIPCYKYSLDYPLVVGDASMLEIVKAIQRELTRYAELTPEFDRQSCGGKGYGLNPDEWRIALNGENLSLYTLDEIMRSLPLPDATPLVEVQYTGKIY